MKVLAHCQGKVLFLCRDILNTERRGLTLNRLISESLTGFLQNRDKNRTLSPDWDNFLLSTNTAKSECKEELGGYRWISSGI